MQPLIWPDCRNVRDLGGLPAAGGELQAGRLIRSDNLDQLGPAGLAAVEAAGISRFVDLRSVWECEKYPSPYAGDPRWHNAPLSHLDDEDVSELGLFEEYRVLVDDHSDRIVAAMLAIADAPPGCVVVNCHAGKDRTGIVIALILDLVGVPQELIATDYEASEASPDTILRLLTHIDQHHGGTPTYLSNSGVTTNQLTTLTSRLTG